MQRTITEIRRSPTESAPDFQLVIAVDRMVFTAWKRPPEQVPATRSVGQGRRTNMFVSDCAGCRHAPSALRMHSDL